jgi:hypothetical protein
MTIPGLEFLYFQSQQVWFLFLLCIRARLQSCHSAAKMVGALVPAAVKSALNPKWETAQGLKPHFLLGLYGTTKVMP